MFCTAVLSGYCQPFMLHNFCVTVNFVVLWVSRVSCQLTEWHKTAVSMPVASKSLGYSHGSLNSCNKWPYNSDCRPKGNTAVCNVWLSTFLDKRHYKIDKSRPAVCTRALVSAEVQLFMPLVSAEVQLFMPFVFCQLEQSHLFPFP
jgi:hypothetical protein